MRVDLDYEFVDLSGKMIPSGEMEEKKDDDGKVLKDEAGNPQVQRKGLTMRTLLISGLAQGDFTASPMGGRVDNLSAEEKVRWGLLAQKLYEAERHYEASAEDITLFKKMAHKVATEPVIMLQAYQQLDPSDKALGTSDADSN